jgi:hypothetical protein
MVPNTRPRNSGADINTHVLAALSLASLSFICLLLVLVPGLNISYGKLNGSSFAVVYVHKLLRDDRNANLRC